MKTGLRAPWLGDPKFAPRTLATLRRGPPKEKSVFCPRSHRLWANLRICADLGVDWTDIHFDDARYLESLKTLRLGSA